MNGVPWNALGVVTLAVMILTAGGMWLAPAGQGVILATGIATLCAAFGFALWRAGSTRRTPEPDEIEQIDEARRSELIRGSSMHLRELRYRYSVRSDRTDAARRKAFTTEINTIRLGFLPVILTDNETDYQGYGYLAFVYDGQRWRGPGLPCPDGREEAMAHAERNVSPVSDES